LAVCCPRKLNHTFPLSKSFEAKFAAEICNYQDHNIRQNMIEYNSKIWNQVYLAAVTYCISLTLITCPLTTLPLRPSIVDQATKLLHPNPFHTGANVVASSNRVWVIDNVDKPHCYQASIYHKVAWRLKKICSLSENRNHFNPINWNLIRLTFCLISHFTSFQVKRSVLNQIIFSRWWFSALRKSSLFYNFVGLIYSTRWNCHIIL
jgi:hypothetical protein